MHGVDPVISPPVMDALREAARATAGLDLLLLFGSRARGDAGAASDWDVGYLATAEFDVAALLATIVEIVGNDRIDLVDLRRASGLLRYRAARDGRSLHEARPGIADQFCFEAVRFWCDAAPVLERGYVEVLAELKP
jgi:predicted nucleotidyltransferase